MNSLRNSLKQRKNILTRFVGTSENPGLYPSNLKKSIQNTGPIETMTDAKRSIIMQEFQIYVSSIEDSVKKIREETMELVSEIYSVDEDLNDPTTVDALINKFNEGSRDYTNQGANCIDILTSDVALICPPDPVPPPTPGTATVPVYQSEPRFSNLLGYPATLLMD